MTQITDANSVKQELSEQNANSKCSRLTSNSIMSDSGFDDLLSQNLDFAESLQLLAKSGRLASSKISVKTKFDKKTTDILKNWLLKNIDNPYPSDEVKDKLCEMTGLNKKQIQNWFTNTRKRYVQPLKRKLKNESLSAEMSSESGGSQNTQEIMAITKSEDNLQKPQSVAKSEPAELSVASNLTSTTIPSQVFPISHSTPVPTLILPNQLLLPGLDSAHVANNIAFGGLSYQQDLKIPQIAYAGTFAPQTYLIDRNLLNIDQSSYLELQKEAESKKKISETFYD
jgi:hypothetical protein